MNSSESGLNRNYIVSANHEPRQHEGSLIANTLLNLDTDCYLDCIPNISTSFHPGNNSLYHPLNDPKMVEDGAMVLAPFIDAQFSSVRPRKNMLGMNVAEIQYAVPPRHSLVSSPSHSEVMDRQSYSSVWSSDDSSDQILADLDSILPFDDYSDSVF